MLFAVKSAQVQRHHYNFSKVLMSQTGDTERMMDSEQIDFDI